MPAKMTGKPDELLSYYSISIGWIVVEKNFFQGPIGFYVETVQSSCKFLCLRMDAGHFVQDIFILLHILNIKYK